MRMTDMLYGLCTVCRTRKKTRVQVSAFVSEADEVGGLQDCCTICS